MRGVQAQNLAVKNAFGVHKDQAPEATVHRIRRILAGIGVKPVEQQVRFAEHCYSTRLDHPRIAAGTNGKGVSPLYSRASAYAEFMERTQTLALFGAQFGAMPGIEDVFPDAKRLPTRACLADLRPLLRQTCDDSAAVERSLAKFFGATVLAVPYYSPTDGSVTYFPKRLLDETLASNGMCAGNTAEEALVQGLCEILERHALRSILLEEIPAPTIPEEALRSLRSYRIIRRMAELGFTIIVKDCTLGGKVPVVGVILLNPQRNKYRVTFGADPIFDVALQRCVTEVAQNYDPHTIESVMKDLRGVLAQGKARIQQDQLSLQYVKSFLDGEGSFTEAFFFTQARPRYRQAFLDRVRPHRQMLDWLVEKVRALAPSIYVRNMSFLGFPTYQVYVPGLSDLRRLDRRAVQTHFVKRAAIRRSLLQLPRLSVREADAWSCWRSWPRTTSSRTTRSSRGCTCGRRPTCSR